MPSRAIIFATASQSRTAMANFGARRARSTVSVQLYNPHTSTGLTTSCKSPYPHRSAPEATATIQCLAAEHCRYGTSWRCCTSTCRLAQSRQIDLPCYRAKGVASI